MICVHGLGYVGLATASLFANAGHDVVGYDTSEAVRASLRERQPRVTEPEFRTFVVEALDSGLTVSDHPVAADFHMICVPTPYDEATERAGLAYVESAGRAVAGVLRPGDVVVLESTVPPGTTETVLVPVLEAGSGLTAGEDFGVAFTPETVLPGNTVAELHANDRIVGGVDVPSREAVRALYATAIDGETLPAPDCATAEFAKLAQNASRDASIAFANELAKVARDYGVDPRAAIGLANHHPRVAILNPGPGVGGHCLPVDPHFFKENSDQVVLVDAARRVNDSMPGYVVDLLEEAVDGLAGRTVAVLGVAYKGDVNDIRNSPGLAIASLLGVKLPAHVELPHRAVERTAPLAATTDGGADTASVTTRLTDPYVTDGSLGLVSLEEALRGADAAVLAAPHTEYAALDPAWVAELGVDTVVDPFGLLPAGEWAAEGVRVVGY